MSGNVLGSAIYEISVDDSKFNRGLDDADRKSSGLFDKLKSVGTNLAVFGLATQGVKVLTGAVGGFVDAAAESQQVAAQTASAIASTGGAAGLTADQIGDLASSLSKVTPIDDEVIQSAENMLLTFTNIGKDVFPQATKAILDMSVATGTDAKGAAVQLGKALNDPIAGISALTRVGVTFTQGQKDAIKAMVEAGDTAGAQKLILAELGKEFGGSAEAAGKTFGGQLAIAKTQLGNLQEGLGLLILPLATKFLPLLTTSAIWLGDKLPKAAQTLQGWLRRLGSELRGPFDRAWSLVTDGIDTFRAALRGNWVNDSGIRPFHRVLGELGLLIHEHVEPPVRDLVAAVKAMKEKVDPFLPSLHTLWQTFQDINTVLNPVHTIVWDIVKGFGADGLGGVLPGAKKGLDDVKDAFGRLKDKAENIGGLLLDALQNVDWSAVATKVGDGVGAAWGGLTTAGGHILDWVTGGISGIAWGDAAASIADGIGSAWGLLKSAGTAVKDWVVAGVTAVADVNWGNVASTIGDAVGKAWGKLTTAASAVYDWLKAGVAAVRDVDWRGVASDVGRFIADAWGRLTSAATAVYDWISGSLSDVKWGDLAGEVGSALGRAIRTIKGLPDDIKAALNPKDADYYGTGYDVGVQVGRGASQGFADNQQKDSFWETYKTNASNNLKKVGIDVGELAKGIGGAMSGIGVFLQAAGPEFEKMALLAGAALYGLLYATKYVVSGVVGLISGLGLIVGAVFTGIGKSISYINETVLPALHDGVKIEIKAIGDLIHTDWSQTWDDAKQKVVDTISGLWDSITGYLDTLKSNTIGWVTGTATDLGTNLLGWSSAFVGWITTTTTDLPGKLASILKSVLDFIGGTTTGAASTIISYLGSWASSFVNWVDDAVRDLPGKLADILTSIGGWVTNPDNITTLANHGIDIASDLLSGIAKGIYDKGKEIVGAALNWLGGLVPGWAKKALDALSPSKKMIPVGVTIPQGLGVGILKGTPYVGMAMQQLGDYVTGYPIGSPMAPPLSTGGMLNPPQLGTGGALNPPSAGPGSPSLPGTGPYPGLPPISGYNPPSSSATGNLGLQALAAEQQHALDKMTVAYQEFQAAVERGDQTQIAQRQYDYQQAILAYQAALAAYQAAVTAQQQPSTPTPAPPEMLPPVQSAPNPLDNYGPTGGAYTGKKIHAGGSQRRSSGGNVINVHLAGKKVEQIMTNTFGQVVLRTLT